MVVKDIKLQSISAPIPVPGTQLEPTIPSVAALSAAGSTTIIHISSNGGNHDSTTATTTTVSAGKATLSNGGSSVGSNGSGVSAHGGGHHHSHSTGSSTVMTTSRMQGATANTSGQQGAHNNANNNLQQQSGLRRFTSIGTKKLSNENLTLRAKVAELERYLTGLKEELILAHRQLHAKAQESKTMEERKSHEIHELGQHIQRCEFDLLAKTAECETLQRKLHFQTKEHMTRLKQINMLETEIMDFRRMSLDSPVKPNDESSSSGHLGVAGSAMPTSADEMSGQDGGLESVRSSACLEAHRASSLYEGTHEQLRLMREENMRKDKTIEELLEKVDRLGTEVLKLEREKARLEYQQQALEQQKEGDKKESRPTQPSPLTMARLMNPITAEAIIAATTPNHSSSSLSALGATLSGSVTENSFISVPETATSSSHGGVPSRLTPMATSSVGYDWWTEHPKLLSKYQALQRKYAEVMEYVQAIEGENRELKVQVLGVGLLDNAAPDSTEPMNFAAGEMPNSLIGSPSSSPPPSRAPAVPGKSPQRFSKDGRQSPVATL